MTTIRHLLAAVAVAILIAAMPALAQESRPAGRGGPLQILEQLRAAMGELNLTPEQKTKMEAIGAETREKVAAMRDDFEKNQTPPAERMAKVREVLQDVRGKIDAVLDDAQKAKLAELMQQAGARGPMMMIERVRLAIGKLDLNDDQKAKVEKIMADTAKQAEAAIKEAQTEKSEREAVAQKIRALMEDSRKQLQDVLTPEQAAKLRELMTAGREEGKK